jgi:hypothetical protein
MELATKEEEAGGDWRRRKGTYGGAGEVVLRDTFTRSLTQCLGALAGLSFCGPPLTPRWPGRPLLDNGINRRWASMA